MNAGGIIFQVHVIFILFLFQIIFYCNYSVFLISTTYNLYAHFVEKIETGTNCRASLYFMTLTAPMRMCTCHQRKKKKKQCLYQNRKEKEQ